MKPIKRNRNNTQFDEGQRRMLKAAEALMKTQEIKDRIHEYDVDVSDIE